MTEALATIAAFFPVIAVRLRLRAAGDERRKAIDVIVLRRLCGRLRLLAIVAVTVAEILFARLLLIARIGLLLTLLELLRLLLRHEAGLCAEARIAVGIVAVVVERIAIGALHRLLLLLRLALAELFLRGCDQTEIVLGVLQITFRHDRVAGGLGVARKLQILFRDMLGGATDLHIRSVRFVAAGQGIRSLAVVIPSAHPLVLTWSH